MTNEEREEAVEWFKAHNRIDYKDREDLISREDVKIAFMYSSVLERRLVAHMRKIYDVIDSIPSAHPKSQPDIEAMRKEIEQLSGNKYKTYDFYGNIVEYEDINKADVLEIIDNHIQKGESE